MFETIKTLMAGMVSVLAFTTPPLYRHPHRGLEEALHGDFKRLAADIDRVLHTEEEHG